MPCGITFNNSVSAQLPTRSPPAPPAAPSTQAFGDQLTQQAGPSCPERRANRDLALAAGGAGEQQAGNVRARNQQHETDSAEQQQQRSADVPDDLVAKAPKRNPATAVALGEAARLLRGNGREILLSLFDVDPWKQPADRLDVMHAAACEQVAGNIDGRHRHRFAREHPGLSLFGVANARRHHANDRVRNAVDAYPGVDDGRVRREVVPPRVVAEHDQRFGRSRIGGTAEGPAERGPHAEDIEVVHGYECPGDPDRLPPGHRDGVCVLPIPGDSGERVVVVLQFQKVSGCEGRSRLIRGRVPDLDEIVGARVRQRPQEHAIDDAEDGGVRSDAKRQRHQDDGSQARCLEEGAQCIPDVVEHGFGPLRGARCGPGCRRSLATPRVRVCIANPLPETEIRGKSLIRMPLRGASPAWPQSCRCSAVGSVRPTSGRVVD